MFCDVGYCDATVSLCIKRNFFILCNFVIWKFKNRLRIEYVCICFCKVSLSRIEIFVKIHRSDVL